jgi:ubiquinone/menaquinone biosynthesis C-methylase UbiE
MMYETTPNWFQELFEKLGKKYLDLPFTQGTIQEVDFTVDLLDLPKNLKILDVGCGAGRHSIELAKRDYQVTGLDFSHRMVEIANERAERERVEVEFLHGDARKMDFDTQYDAALSLCEGAFGIMENDEQNTAILKNIYQALRKNGKLLLNILNASFIFRHPEQDTCFDPKSCIGYWEEKFITENGNHEKLLCSNRYYTFPEIKLILEHIGFKVIDGYGCAPGNFQKREIELDDFEILVFALKS